MIVLLQPRMGRELERADPCLALLFVLFTWLAFYTPFGLESVMMDTYISGVAVCFLAFYLVFYFQIYIHFVIVIVLDAL